MDNLLSANDSVWAVVPAAGIGTRMQAALPKQYLTLCGRPLLELTLDALLSHPRIDKVVVALSPSDPYWASLTVADHPDVIVAHGGLERADSVLSALERVEADWALVHDAARPCLQHSDIDALLQCVQQHGAGAILGMPVRDTMKWVAHDGQIERTVDRSRMWHALTPQLFPTEALKNNIRQAITEGVAVTDESSAMEWAGWQPKMVPGRMDNIKVTHPDDLRLAEIYLQALPTVAPGQ